MKQCPLNSQDIIYNILAMEREGGKVMKDNNINLLLVIAHPDDEIISDGVLIRCFQSMNASCIFMEHGNGMREKYKSVEMIR